MSGGHFEYNCFRISNFAEDLNKELLCLIDREEFDEQACYTYTTTATKKLKTSQKLIEIIGELAYSIEWLYSGDIGDDKFEIDYNSLIKKLKRIIKDGEKT